MKAQCKAVKTEITLTLTEEEAVAIGYLLYRIGGTFDHGNGSYPDLYTDLVRGLPENLIFRTRETLTECRPFFPPNPE